MRIKTKSRQALLCLALVTGVGGVLAHGELQPQHGGVRAEAKSGHRVELLAKDGQLQVFLTDHDDKPLSTAQASGELTLLQGKTKSTLALQAQAPNKLVAAGTAGAGAKLIVRYSLAGQPAEQVRLAIK